MKTRSSRFICFAGVLSLPLTVSLAAESPDAVYRKLSGAAPEPVGRAVVDNGEFDLRRNDVSDVMLGKVNRPAQRGDTPAAALRTIVSRAPETGVRWLTQNWDKLTPVGRKHALAGLCSVDFRETYELVEWLLDDREGLSDSASPESIPNPAEPEPRARGIDVAVIGRRKACLRRLGKRQAC